MIGGGGGQRGKPRRRAGCGGHPLFVAGVNLGGWTDTTGGRTSFGHGARRGDGGVEVRG